MGSGIGGLETIYNGSLTIKNLGPRKLSPFFIPSSLINLLSGQISIKYGFKGPNHSVVTACATGAHSIGDAGEMIKRGAVILWLQEVLRQQYVSLVLQDFVLPEV